MKRTNRIWLMGICAIVSVLGAARPVYAQQDTGYYDDGTFYISAYVDVDSSYNLYVDSYMEVEFDGYEDIDEIEVDAYVDEDGQTFGSDYGDGDDYDPAEVALQSNSPVPTGHEYGMESDGYACFDDGEGDCDWEYVGSAYASVSVASPTPQTFPPDPCAVTSNPKVGYSSIVSTGTTGGSGTISVSFSGAAFAAISQSVTYGPYSTPSSIAAHIAALITKNYLQYGLSARAFGPNIIYGGTAPLGTVGVTSGSSFTTDTSSTAATAAAAACYAIPSFPCLGLWPDYDTPRLYVTDGITETPRQHIMRKHILGAPTLGPPPNTVYANTVGATPDQLFSIVQQYNFNTALWGNPSKGGGLDYTFPSVTIGGVTYGLIGKDGAGNDLSTNHFVLSADRCKAVTSYPIAP